MIDTKHISLRAFSLVELSVVIVILSVIAGGGITLFNQYSTSSKIAETKARMRVILQAVDDYYDAYYNPTDIYTYARIPAPADNGQNFSVTDDNAISTGNLSNAAAFGISSGRASPVFTCGTSNKGGFVPTYTLRIPPEYAFDAWGNRILYTCNSNGMTNLSNSSGTAFRDATVVTPVVALVSSGPNQKGAYMGRNAAAKRDYDVHSRESNNRNFSGQLTDSPTYQTYDDITMFITLQQMKAGEISNPYFENK